MKPSIAGDVDGSIEVKYVPWYPSSSASDNPELGSSLPAAIGGAEERMLDPGPYPGSSGRWYIYDRGVSMVGSIVYDIRVDVGVSHPERFNH